MAGRVVVLIRHGDYQQLPDTPSAHQPFGLTNRGRQQAIDCVDRVLQMAEQHNWEIAPVMHSSNLLRAWQTASILKQGLPAVNKIEGFDALAERGLGSAANLTVQQIEKVLQEDPRFEIPPADWKSNSHYCLPLQGAESLMDAGVRVAEHIRQAQLNAAENDRDQMQIIVGHGAAMRHAAHHLGVLEFKEIARLSMYHATPVAIAMDEHGKWQHVAGQWKLRTRSNRELD